MLYKATLTFSLLFLTVAGSAQSDGGNNTSGQPQPALSSVVRLPQAMPSQIGPSGSPMTIDPTASHGVSQAGPIHSHNKRPSHCQPHSAIPTVTGTFQQSSGGNLSSAAYNASLPSGSNSTAPTLSAISGCQPYSDSKSIIPTMTANIQTFSDGAMPTANASLISNPNQTITPGQNGSQPDNSTLPTASSQPIASVPVQVPPMSTASYASGEGLYNAKFEPSGFGYYHIHHHPLARASRATTVHVGKGRQ